MRHTLDRLLWRKRCDARNRSNFIVRGGVVVRCRGEGCRAWAMENGRCRHQTGLSTGARTAEGQARSVAAMVAGVCAGSRRRGPRGGRLAAAARAATEAERLGIGTLDDLPKTVIQRLNGLARERAHRAAQAAGACIRHLSAAASSRRHAEATARETTAGSQRPQGRGHHQGRRCAVTSQAIRRLKSSFNFARVILGGFPFSIACRSRFSKTRVRRA
jgi:hypothetical protein